MHRTPQSDRASDAGTHGPLALYTVNEVADLLKISQTKCYQLISAGHIAVHKIGGSLRISEADLLAYITSCRVVNGRRESRTASPPPKKLRHLKIS